MAFSFLPMIKNAFAICLSLMVCTACDDGGTKEILTYDGPQREIEKVAYYNSEKGKVTVKLTADLAYELQDGDREFPKGIYIEFYDTAGNIASTLKANSAYFFKDENKWQGKGNVEVKNVEKNEQLNTEELFWSPKDQKIHTDKFVTIRQQNNLLHGEGLDAKQDLSEYTVLNINDSDLDVDE